jgi:glycosyltransferase involved in cell wall biosynthesis
MPVPAAAVTVILPCLNEALALPSVLSRISSSYQVIVVDNGSTDGSRKVAAEYGARVLLEPCLGYGAAVHTGVRAAVTDLVCILDADGSIDPAVLPQLIEPLNAGGADLVIGRRRPTTYGALPLHARWANAAVAARLRHCTSLRVRDLGAVRACRRQELLALGVRDRRCGYPVELLVRAAHAGWTVVEIDVPYGRRTAGTRSKITGSLRGTLRTARDFSAVLP